MSEYCNNCNGTGYVRDGYDGEKPCPWCNEPEETTLRDEEAERNPQPVSAQLEPVNPEGDAAYWRARAEKYEGALGEIYILVNRANVEPEDVGLLVNIMTIIELALDEGKEQPE